MGGSKTFVHVCVGKCAFQWKMETSDWMRALRSTVSRLSVQIDKIVEFSV